MAHTALIGVLKPRRLAGIVEYDVGPVPPGRVHSLDAADGSCHGSAPLVRQGPVVAVVGQTQGDFLPGDLRQGILHHPPYGVDRRHSQRRAVLIETMEL